MPIAHLQCPMPIVYFWDCTFLGNLEYPWFSKLAAESVRNGHRMEQGALNNCSIAVFSSDWAVKTANDGYKVDNIKLRLAPLGANLDECPKTREDIASIVDARSREKCNLLFLAADWERKGGDLAYLLAKRLNESGLTTTLTIAGCVPKVNERLPDFVRVLGVINKSDQSGESRIKQLLASSHFLLLPSVAESFGAVICEASAFGTPSIGRNVGGIGSAIRDGVNGRLFSLEARVDEYVTYVINTFADYSSYKLLAQSSYDEYQYRLNWNKTAETIVDLCREVASSKKAGINQ
jgi:glycosyltransferase involved in cell wall biosynthesis